MIKLKEIYNTIVDEEKHGLVPTENWKFHDVEYLNDIGFSQNGMYSMMLKRPELMVSYKKPDGFIFKDKKKKLTQKFPTFDALCRHLENYEQQWETQPYL